MSIIKGRMPIAEGEWSKRLLGLRKTVEDIGKTLPPGDDWMPAVLVEGTFPADMPGLDPALINKTGVLLVGFAGDFMGSEEGKNFVAAAMFGLAVKTRATGMTFISTVWMSVVEDIEHHIEGETDDETKARILQEAKARPKPSQDPNRMEKLMMLSVFYGGEDDGHKTCFADVVRSPDKPPRLENWVLYDDPASNWVGRFPDAIYAGLKLSREMQAGEGPKDGN